MNTRAAVDDSGYVDLESPDDSYLLELITSTDPDLQMPPPDRPRMSENEVALVRRWIDQGMTWDADFTFAIDAYEPPLRPRTPELPAAVTGRDHPIDRILDSYLATNALPVPGPIDDAVFLRRVSLDLTGLLPSDQQLDAFIADPNPSKRSDMIDALLGDDLAYAEHWLTFFNDLLRNDYSGTGFITRGRTQISQWLYDSLRSNKPFDVMARELIAPPSDASRGYMDGIKWRGEVSAGQTLPIQFSQSVSQSFLGINMKCASCHDSFVDRWTLKDAYGLAAIYADETLELHRCDKPIGETAQASWLFPELGQITPDAPRSKRLQELADLMTHRENGRFARTIVNRLWYQMMGHGIVHPLDAMQSRPWNEDLLDHLAVELVAMDYDLKSMLRLIANSSAYQSESEVASESSVGDTYVYHGPRSKRMTAEQFIDNVWRLTGAGPDKYEAPIQRDGDDSAENKADANKADEQKADEQKADEQKADKQKADKQKADEQKAGQQKADDKPTVGNDGDGKPMMVRASMMKNNALMKSLGRPMREQIVSMRPDRVTTLEAIDLANEPTLADAFAKGAARLIEQHDADTDRIVGWLYRSALGRSPTSQEMELLRGVLGDQPDPAGVQDAMWAVCMLPEFILIR